MTVGVAAAIPQRGGLMDRNGRRGPRRSLTRAHVERLMDYYHLVQEQRARGGGDTISSRRIAELLDLDDTLVRKDLAAVEVKGCPRVGYSCADIVTWSEQPQPRILHRW